MDGDFESDDFGPDDLIEEVQKWFSYWPVVALLIIGFLVLTFLPSMIYQIDRDEQGLILRFGKLSRQVPPGWGWKLPYPVESLYKINTQKVLSQSFGYRADSEGGSSRTVKSEALILTGDLGVARIQWDVLYRRSDPEKYLFNVKNERKLLRQASQSALRRIVGDFDAVRVITAARREIARRTQRELQSLLDNYNSGLDVSEVNIQQSEPPEPVAPAFRRVNSARQKREEMRHEAERQRERIINEAQGEVERKISVAQGDSAAIINRAKGDARRFKELLQEYEKAPTVTRNRMFLETMEKVMKNSSSVYVVDEKVQGLLPHLNLRQDD